MENAPDLRVAVRGMVEATIVRFLGPDIMQDFRAEVLGGPSPDDRPANLEIALAYGGRSLRRSVVLDDVSDRLNLETTISTAALDMLREMGLV